MNAKKMLRNAGYSSPLFDDLAYRIAKGTDAGFYRLIPQLVAEANSEDDILKLLSFCREHRQSITLKAGGTSLSGQTITSSVLVELGAGFNHFKISVDGRLASFQPGVRGGYANTLLHSWHRKIGPSPASIQSAKIGGIVANNASGASYGISTNSYNTIRAMRIILADGTILDTADSMSRGQFLLTHQPLVRELLELRNFIISNPEIENKIQTKYKLKNTCGYGVNSLIDFEDPVDIISHLMVGSEGTLGIITNVTFETIDDFPLKACALLFLPDIKTAAEAIAPLKNCAVSAAELMDRNALRAVEHNAGMPPVIRTLGPDVAALLIETSAPTVELLELQIKEIQEKLQPLPTVFPLVFTRDKVEFETYWKVRKGLFTSAAAARPQGTSCIIEDIAFPELHLADALEELRELLECSGYHRSVIWGHLLDGNVHFIISPDFREPAQLENYKQFMNQLSILVIGKYNGSLKAEHGTGRNMAAFVQYEWGPEIYEIMRQVKRLFDPENILNPGVVINEDPEVYLKNIKDYAPTHELIDPCIECGFCESQCPSRDFTLTPRQRIVLYRELSRLGKAGKRKNLKEIARFYQFAGIESCATDGLCALNCPVQIDTGKLVKELRWARHGRFGNFLASFFARYFKQAVWGIRMVLRIIYFFQKILPVTLIRWVAEGLYRISGKMIPLWNEYLPTAAPALKAKSDVPADMPAVVYFPACINRIFGVSKDYNHKEALVEKTIGILKKAGYQVIFPDNLNALCCGMAFDSKGYKSQGKAKLKELEAALLKSTRNGKYPVLCEMSPCLLRMKTFMDQRLKLYEPVEFVLDFLTDRLEFVPLPVKVAIHSTCSNTKMGQEQNLSRLAAMCAHEVIKPNQIHCCGWAGDKGFNLPGLNKSALKNLKRSLPDDLHGGYSTSRTCEIGLTLHSGVSYTSVLYLVDQATRPKIN